MELTLLNKPALERLYAREMREDFPQSELKPLRAMLRLMDMGLYEPLLALEDGEPIGYAMMWLLPNGEGALLEYLGILRQKRNAGLGSKLLELLAARYNQILGEAEAPCSPTPAENQLRRRRIAFYTRNGYRVLDYQCALFGVRFHCLYRGPETDDRKVEAMHHGVYARYFSPAHMERYIQLPLKPGEEINPAPKWVEETFPAHQVTLGARTAETAAIYFEKTRRSHFQKVLSQRAKTIEEAVADFHASQLPGAASFGQTILMDGRYVGDIWCYCIHPDDTPSAMVSYCVFEPELWGQGIASQALALFLPGIAQKYGLKTVGAFTFSHNLPSIRVLEKNGFKLVEEFMEDGVSSKYFQLDLL